MFKIDLSKISLADFRKYTKIIFVLVAVGLVVGGYFLWLPKYKEFKSNGLKLDSKDEEVKKKKDYLFELQGYLSSLTEYEENLSKINDALPFDSSTAPLFSLVQNLSSKNGLAITDAKLENGGQVVVAGQVISPGEITLNGLTFDITLVGKYSSFKDFILDLYKNSRIVDLNMVSFSIPTEQQIKERGPDVFEFELELKANFYKTN